MAVEVVAVVSCCCAAVVVTGTGLAVERVGRNSISSQKRIGVVTLEVSMSGGCQMRTRTCASAAQPSSTSGGSGRIAGAAERRVDVARHCV